MQQFFADDEITWTPEQRAELIAPRRRGSAPSLDPAEPPAPAQLWEIVRELAVVSTQAFRGYGALKQEPKGRVKQALDRLQQEERPTVPASLDVEASLFNLLLSQNYLLDSGLGGASALVDLWLAYGDETEPNFDFALRALARAGELGLEPEFHHPARAAILQALSMNLPRASFGLVGGQGEPYVRLRGRLASAPHETWNSARDLAAELRESSVLEVRAALAFLFPEEPEWAEEILADDPLSHLTQDACLLLATATANLDLVLQCIPKDDGFWIYTDTENSWLLSILESVGPALFPYVANVLSVSKQRSRILADYVAAIRHPGAFFALAAGEDARSIKTLRSAAAEHPRIALDGLTRVLAERSHGQELARSVALQLLVADPSLAEQEGLSSAQQKVLEGLVAESAARSVEHAAEDDLPKILVDPPWLKGKKRVRWPTAKATVAPFEDSMFWREGERKQWLKDPDFNLCDARRNAARRGEEGLGGILKRVQGDATQLGALGPYRNRKIAPHVIDGLGKKKGRKPALRLIRRNPRAVLSGLFPLLNEKGKTQKHAIEAVRLIARELDREEMLSIAASANEGTREWIEAILAIDPRDLAPQKKSYQPPGFWQPETWRRPVLKSGGALPDDAMHHLAVMLSFTDFNVPYKGLLDVRDACTAESLAAFAWDLFKAWEGDGAPAAQYWAFEALGLFGDDEVARRLGALLREWPRMEGLYPRAVKGLDVLVLMGSDVSLMLLHHMSQKFRSKGFRGQAQSRIRELAEDLQLTQAELADRLAPSFGLDENGSMLLDYGPRQFMVSFDEQLKPVLRNADGSVRKTLPKPGKKDDHDLAVPASERFKGLKKDVRAVAKSQIERLERAMWRRRRWKLEDFRKYLVDHPLVGHLARRLAWGAFDEANELLAIFRIAEDRTFADAEDDVYEPTAEARFGVVHPLELNEEQCAAFGEILSDYEILQPFPQIGRETYALTPEERKAVEITRWKGKVVPIGPLLRLEKQGWDKGEVMDGGGSGWFERPVFLSGGEERQALLYLEPGIPVWNPVEYDEQKIRELVITTADGRRAGKDVFDLEPISASEMLRGIEGLFEGST